MRKFCALKIAMYQTHDVNSLAFSQNWEKVGEARMRACILLLNVFIRRNQQTIRYPQWNDFTNVWKKPNLLPRSCNQRDERSCIRG